MSHNKLILAFALLATPALAQEPNFDIQDEKLLCIGTQERTGYKQYCVEQCVVNGPSVAFMGDYTPAGAAYKVSLYNMNAQFDCQRGQALGEIFRKKAPSFMARMAREKGCLSGTYIRTVNHSFSVPNKNFAAANAIIECDPSSGPGSISLPQI